MFFRNTFSSIFFPFDNIVLPLPFHYFPPFSPFLIHILEGSLQPICMVPIGFMEAYGLSNYLLYSYSFQGLKGPKKTIINS